jgi:uncharacterized damage-inducible protein DinB
LGRVAIDQLLWLFDRAFEQPASADGDTHSVLGNLSTVPADAWRWMPPRGRRTIADIALHVAACEHVYDDYAFGPGAMSWDSMPPPALVAACTPEDITAWLNTGHAQIRRSLAALDDAALSRSVRTNWGTREEARWIAAVMIEHDVYHAGEINHIRSLYVQGGAWARETAPE